MKTFSKRIFCLTFTLALVLATFLGIFLIDSPKSFAEPASTTIGDLTDSNNFFTIHATPVSRRGGLVTNTKKTVSAEDGEKTFYCMNWRDISSITFQFSHSLTNSKYIFTNYEFLVSFVQTENLETSFGHDDNPKTLASGTISGNIPSFSNVYYYFDKDANTSDSDLKFNGNDFGIYKFDFNYTFLEDAEPDREAHTFSIGELYIAIVPDNIDDISVERLGLTYTVASSNALMNIYNIAFSNPDIFRYVNPKYIKWTVSGKDKGGKNYVLTKKERDDNHPLYYYIWEALPTEMQEGASFILDTNDIEGSWVVHCTIYNTDGTEKLSLSTRTLTTVKHKVKSYLWLILLLVLLAILLAVLIWFIVYKTRNKRKS